MFTDYDQYQQKTLDYNLREAAEQNNLMEVRACLANGACANAVNDELFKPVLYHAVTHQNIEMVRVLVSHGGDMGHVLNWIGWQLLAKKSGDFSVKMPDLYSAEFTSMLKLCFDFAVGCNLKNKYFKGIVEFAQSLSIAGFNFIGVSLDGRPATPELLTKLGCTDVKRAIFTRADLNRMGTPERIADIENQLSRQYRARGELVDKQGIVNLISLENAIEQNDIPALRARLSVEPRLDEQQQELILIAAKNGFKEAVKLLLDTGQIESQVIFSAASEVKSGGQDKVREMLIAQLDLEDQLLLAEREGNIEDVSRLLGQGVHANFKVIYESIFSPSRLFGQKLHDSIMIIEKLLNSADNLNLDKYMRLMSRAVNKGNPVALRLIIEHLKSNHLQGDAFQQNQEILSCLESLLFDALDHTHSNHIALLKVLKDNGAKLSTINKHGSSLMWKAMFQLTLCSKLDDILTCLNIIIWLVDNGVDFSNPASSTSTPLHLFIEKRYYPDVFGEERYIALLDYFVEHNADPFAVDDKNRSAYDIARDTNKIAFNYFCQKFDRPLEKDAPIESTLIRGSLFKPDNSTHENDRDTNVRSPEVTVSKY